MAGPGGATRLLVVSGLALCNLNVAVPSPGGGSATQQGTFAGYVGPTLALAQFRRAIAMVSLASISAAGNLTTHGWSVTGVDADFDEDEGKVKLEFDVRVDVQGPRDGASIYLSEGDQGQPGTWVWIGVEDVGALYEEYKKTQARILQPPENFPWACEMKVGDPDGHVLRFGSEPKDGRQHTSR